MIKAVIIDDETNARETIAGIINMFANHISIAGEGINVESGIKVITELKPDIVFLDISMPDGSGFDLLRHFKDCIDFKVIFVTAFEQYAIQAFKFHAFDYILKPVAPNELVAAINSAVNSIGKNKNNTNQIMNTFLENLSAANKKKKIVLKTAESIFVINIEDIIRLESDVNYTNIFLLEGRRILVSTTLKDYEEMLCDLGFFRVHKTHLINLEHILQFKKADGGQIKMNDNSLIPVSRRKKEELVALLNRI